MVVIKQDPSINVKDMVNQMRQDDGNNISSPKKETTHGDIVTGNDGVAGVVIDSREVAQNNINPTMQRLNDYMNHQDSLINELQNGSNVTVGDDITEEDQLAEQRNLAILTAKAESGDANAASYSEELLKVMEEASSWDTNDTVARSVKAQEDFLAKLTQNPVNKNAPQPQKEVQQIQTPPKTPDVSTGVDNIFEDVINNGMPEVTKNPQTTVFPPYTPAQSQSAPKFDPDERHKLTHDQEPDFFSTAEEVSQQSRETSEQQRTEAIAAEQMRDVNQFQHDVLGGQEPNNSSVVQFNVPKGEGSSFISTLPASDRTKITRASKIIVSETERKFYPTQIRQIKNMDEFKKIIPRRIHSEVVGVPLINSGIYATFKGAGSMAMATLIPDRVDKDGTRIADYAKRYQFCYDCLVDTSIGKMSFPEFCFYVAVDDLDLCIYAIMRASEPEQNEITLTCGNEDCLTDYDIKYNMSTVPDYDKLTPEMKQEIDRIIAAKDVFENAKRVHEQSAIMQIKTVDVPYTDGSMVSFDFKVTNGVTMIERYPLIKQVVAQHSVMAATFLLLIPKAYYTAPDKNTYEITDPEAIIALLNQIDDFNLKALRQVIESMKQFPAITYSFKGNYCCPNCRKREERIPCNVYNLVFFKVGRLMEE